MYENKKRILTLLIIAAIVFSFFTIYIYSKDEMGISARSAALYVPETETFLYKKRENERLSMASTTKIMTAFIALDTLEPDALIEIPKEAVGIEGSSLYLEEGEILTANDLILGLMLSSANDAAVALAIEISGSVSDFAILMNEYARELSLYDTEFKNPHGLDEEGHFTTAHDLALLGAHALENESFKNISSTRKAKIVSDRKERVLVNHNKLLERYSGAIGVKTGYTKKSGRSLVSAAERDGLTLVAVTIDAPDDWRDHTALLDYGYSKLEKVYLAKSGEYSYKIPVYDGNKAYLTVSNKDELTKIFNKGDADFLVDVKLSRYTSAPIKKGAELGELVFTKDGIIIGNIPLLAEEDINKKERRFFFKEG